MFSVCGSSPALRLPALSCSRSNHVCCLSLSFPFSNLALAFHLTLVPPWNFFSCVFWIRTSHLRKYNTSDVTVTHRTHAQITYTYIAELPRSVHSHRLRANKGCTQVSWQIGYPQDTCGAPPIKPLSVLFLIGIQLENGLHSAIYPPRCLARELQQFSYRLNGGRRRLWRVSAKRYFKTTTKIGLMSDDLQ